MYKYEVIKLDSPLPIRVIQFKYKKNDQSNVHKVELHWHKNIEIIVAEVGDLAYTVNGKEGLLKAGNVLIINSNEIHKTTWTRTTDEYIGYCIQIDYDFFEKNYPNISNILFNNLLDENANDQISSIIKDIVFSSLEKGINYEILVNSQLLLLLYYLLKYSSNIEEYSKGDSKISPPVKMRKILAYIHINYNKNIDSKSVADYFGISHGYLIRLFNDNIGIPPKRYIDEFRLERAAEQIIYTDESIINIAFFNGFSNVNSFYKMFNKKYGISPNKYRKQKQK